MLVTVSFSKINLTVKNKCYLFENQFKSNRFLLSSIFVKPFSMHNSEHLLLNKRERIGLKY